MRPAGGSGANKTKKMSELVKTKVLDQLREYEPKVKLLEFANKLKLEGGEERNDSKYVYEIATGRYVLKGQRMHIPLADDKFLLEKYNEALKRIIFICQEYYSTKIANLFCPHFVKVVGIDSQAYYHTLGLTVYTEMVFEMGGTSLVNSKVPRNFKNVYNIMRQTAVAMDTLHSAGISHLDLKPGNILYDEIKDLVNVIDMGTCNLYASESTMGRAVTELAKSVREMTAQYAAPEQLQAVENSKTGVKFTGHIDHEDIYSYAMTFYVFITPKKQCELDTIQSMRMYDGKSYTQFLDQVKEEVGAVKCMDEAEKAIQKFVVDLLEQCLGFVPKSRPSFADILRKMTQFEKDANIRLPYFETYTKYVEKLSDRWPIPGDINKVLLKELREAKEEIAKLSATVETERREKDRLLQTLEDLRHSLDDAVAHVDPMLAPTEESTVVLPSKSVNSAKFKGDLMKVIETALRDLHIDAKTKDKTEYQSTMHCKTCESESSCPVKLSCGHRVCLGCATKRVERTCAMDQGSILCYRCRSKIGIFMVKKLR